jgi:predicted nucleotidyltransferase
VIAVQRTNIYLEEEQLRALKHLAAEERQSVADLVREAVDDYLAKHMADETLWQERFETLIERVRSRVPAKIPPAEIGADISAARDGVRRAHRATPGSLTDRVRPGDTAGATLGNDPVLDEIVKRLVRALRPQRIYLFGSKARGGAGPDSDYDLMVVVPHTTEPGYRLAQRAHALLWDIGTAADILVWSREAFDGRLHLRASLPATVVREGKLLYAT